MEHATAATPALDAVPRTGDPHPVLPDTSWLLLIWTGLAATIFAAAVVAPLAARETRGSLLFMRPASVTDLLLLAVLGIIVYPAVYGTILDALHSASILTGAALGLAHALVLLLTARVQRIGSTAVRTLFLTHVAYGAVLGFLYVTP
jgi:hypothetical protein